ncbi:autophagy-related protein 16-1 isoform X2 [Cimex lectularius]|uniref:Autophagy-related protein 16 domain-containing protein n=1 Tax=Cimex lectularius TaxID=79782 RepID=A0A8I6S137_CIMLE|nr:autophagy-related protein 16-1 isoform X2 [Cimex lectularius]
MEPGLVSSGWRDAIFTQIQTRNRVLCNTFQDLITAHNRLFEVQNELRQENENLIREGAAGGTDGTNRAAEQRISLLESKLMAQQVELTELHKARGDNMHMVVDLNRQVKEKEAMLKKVEQNLTEAVAKNTQLFNDIVRHMAEKSELQNANQLIRDEHTALQLAYSQLEEKLRKYQEENAQLVDRLMKYKSKDAEKMNEENDNFLKKRYAKIQKELEEAAKESSKSIPLEPYVPDSAIPDKSAVPTTVAISFDAHESEISAVKWSPVDKIVATGGTDRKVKLWDISKGLAESKGQLVGSNASVMSVNFDTNGSFILGASNDFATRVWGATDLRLKHTLTGHSGKVLAAKFLGEPTKVVTGSHDRTLKLWDLRSRACIETKFAGSCCNDIVISDSAGTTIISGHFDKKIRFWDTRTDTNINEILVQGKVTSLDLARDGKTLLACVRDDTLRLIDLRANQMLTTYSYEGFKVACDWTRAVFSNTADFVCVGSNDGGVYVWNTASGNLETVLKKHTCPVIAVSWHPFANYIASVDKSKKAVVWADL